MITKYWEEVLQTHVYILNNTNEVIPYLYAQKDRRIKNPRQVEEWMLMEHNKTLMT